MRSIRKQTGAGYHLRKANTTPPSTPQEAESRWSRFAHKEVVLRQLLREQYGLCCYSELRADQESLGYHIEHIENKRQNPSRTFDYTNLSASALHSDGLGAFKGRSTELFGGQAVGKQDVHRPVDMLRFISPLRAGCHRFFAYLSDGRVVPAVNLDPAECECAQYTIDTLNLNSPFLQVRRRQWWDELDSNLQENLDNGWSISHLAALDLIPTVNPDTQNDELSRFFSLTRQFFGPIAEQLLQQQAPELQ
ncbi:MAG: TIGR02646 family protein [Xanthomonadales bacterium]|jgi:uncharacterized protein (TIGR02646 family)|nr:TIGR02646 family protein [Xanthomonadales bacterium]